MQYLDLTLPSPAGNLACDEALLDLCETRDGLEILRFWESPQHFVVLGYGNHAVSEANLDACAEHNIPVLRRTSGGGTVLQGPGCLNYSLILHITEGGPLQSIPGTNRFILERNTAALTALLGRPVVVAGDTDLALGPMKFSGNAQRRKRRCLLFHGSILLHFNLALLDLALAHPTREPGYRQHRSHCEFVRNLNLSADAIKSALRTAWQAPTEFTALPHQSIEKLVTEKYSQPSWNLKF